MLTPQQLAELRRFNLEILLGSRFQGSKADLARAINKSEAYVWQLLNERKTAKGMRVVFGEKVAREIEAALQLAHGELDSPGPQRGVDKLSGDEDELLRNYRGAQPAWRATIKLLSGLPLDAQAALLEKIRTGQSPLPPLLPTRRGRRKPR
jgi:hypothetical protein